MTIRDKTVKEIKYDDVKVGQIFCNCSGYYDDDKIHIINDLFCIKTNYNHSSLNLHTGYFESFLPDERVIGVEGFQIHIVEAPKLTSPLTEITDSCGFSFNNNIYVKSVLDENNRTLCIDISNGTCVWIDNDAEVNPLRIEGVY